MKHERISMVGVMASTGGAILAASAVLLSTTLVFASPPGTASNPNFPGSTGPVAPSGEGMDLPMAPTYLGAPAPKAKEEPPKPIETPEATDPRDTPPPTFFGEEIDTETDSIIYVIDISGSMSIVTNPFEDENGAIVQQGNRLDRAKAELKKSVEGLGENYKFNVYVYDECTVGCWGEKQQATEANKQLAYSWISAVQPDGWTNTGLAVQTALEDKENKTIVLLSDGSPNFLDCSMMMVGSFDDHAKLIQNANTQGATVNTFGIGISGDADARGFMQRVAAENSGAYTDVN